MKRLAKYGRSVIGTHMRDKVVGFLAVLAMVFAGLHAPAIASDVEHGHSTEILVHYDALQDRSDADPAQDQSDSSSAVSHHHHCPVIALPDLSDQAECAVGQREIFGFRNVAALGSLAPQPLIDPPSL